MTTPIGDRQGLSSVCPHCGRPIETAYYFERRRLSGRRTYTALVPNSPPFGERHLVEVLRNRALM